MTIYFSGHTFKYELEGICKLFFPLKRFSHRFDRDSISLLQEERAETETVFTRRKRLSETTLLWVRVKVGDVCLHKTAHISNHVLDYENECERLLCLLLFALLQKYTGLRPGWGILTGVRPVSILQRLRREGKSYAQIRTFFKEKYLVSEEKLNLAMQTAAVQAPLLEQFQELSYSLYIAIPFCVSRCNYCSFVSHSIASPKATDRIELYLDLLCEELKLTAALAEEAGLLLHTVYIGGGTPTALSSTQLQRVTDVVAACFDLSCVREYTIEAGRADTITAEKLQVIRESGATRISVNPQSFQDTVLKAAGRPHTAKEAADCFTMARDMGFSWINMDLIAGLLEDTPEGFRDSIDKAVALAPENITVHTLSVKRSADLFTADGIESYVKTGQTAQMTDYAHRRLIKAGYLPYYLYRQKNTVGNLENVGYTKPGFESPYNVYIMEEMQTILACGAGGVTKLVGCGGKPIERIFNFKYHFEYIDRFEQILSRKREIKQFYEHWIPSQSD